ncbi:MAG: hypothetical protein HYS98_08990 [Deltaproteobacteria bacterium]|nr:hypothetical protein [Deltaproteobacteria bacterium]
MNFRYIRLIIVLCCVAYPTFNKAEEAEEIDLLRQGAFEVDVGLRSRRIDKIYETPCQLLTVIDTTCKACPSNPLNTELSSYLGKVFTACELYRQHEAEIATYRELKSKKIRQIDMCNRQYPIGSSRIPVCKLDVHKKFNERL